MAVKSDSSLLNQGKPFFLPDWSEDVHVNPCIALRVCRLGRSIEPKFAVRYYDAMAYGIDFQATDWLKQGKMTEALAFDSALCVGEWMPPAVFRTMPYPLLNVIEQTFPIERAVADISRIMTLRMGDILYIDLPKEAQPIQREEVFEYEYNGQPLLYCRIK